MHAQFTDPTQLDPHELRWVGLKNPPTGPMQSFKPLILRLP